MSGRKVFTAGEVLQAADVNDYLMDQSVMVFAGTAARGSAIPSPSEGMVTYLSDSDSVQVYNGSAFVPVGSDPGLVETKTALKTDAFSASVASGGNTTITGLSITHSLSNASNKLLFIAYVGTAATNQQQGRVGIALADGGSLVGIADAVGSRARVAAGGKMVISNSSDIHANLSINLLYSPGDTASHTYTLEAINMGSSTHTLYINRNQTDADTINDGRSSSVLTLMEVSA